ncbi:hypothetical protein MHEL_03310 [Mycolicibacterium helvum]|uniref:UvrD-like helicase C-terminal domain-containing protein n=1 Tax=Mycolicibacterium helvum TaxID=1534349 RepID=A0A7I7SZ64_9MYCO|nr:hypothetical protein MHEL_03310 [Mycolicibacterium helvum]
MREGAGDDGLTVAKALRLLHDNTLKLDEATVVVIDEAGMVGTDDLRQLLTATTRAGAKTVLVGDASQLAPVKARGGMFAQLCTDLPWTQRLSEVWRMSDPEERTASLALRDGEPAARRDAVDWYRSHDRLHHGDAITMAADALAAYTADAEVGRDALLVCDTTEMADALNLRIHNDRIDRNARSVVGARGQHISVGDLIISRRNDPTIAFHHSTPNAESLPSVRNGNRWRVAAIDAKTNRVAAERLDDNARVVFENDYVREHVSLGYAVTVHSAQGVTADACHAVLSDTASRNLLYVAMTRGRHANIAHIYERSTEASEFGHEKPAGTHLTQRGDSSEAATLIHGILACAEPTITAHDYAGKASEEALPDRVRDLLNMRAAATERRQAVYGSWKAQREEHNRGMAEAPERHISGNQDRSTDYGLEL